MYTVQFLLPTVQFLLPTVQFLLPILYCYLMIRITITQEYKTLTGIRVYRVINTVLNDVVKITM